MENFCRKGLPALRGRGNLDPFYPARPPSGPIQHAPSLLWHGFKPYPAQAASIIKAVEGD